MKYVNYVSNTIINDESSLFIIEDGKIEVLEYGKQVKVLGIGDSFGEYSFFSGEKVKTQFKTLTQTQVYQINRQEFFTFVQQNRQDLEKFMFIKDSLLNKNYKIIGLSCISCSSKIHLIQDCQLLNYKLNILKMQESGIQERVRFSRQSNKNQTFTYLSINLKALEKLREKYWELQEQMSDAKSDFISCTDESSYHLTNKTQISKNGSKRNKQSNQSQQFQGIDDNFDSQFDDTPQFDKILEVPGQLAKFQIIDNDSNMEPKQTQFPLKQIKENESLGNILNLCNTSSLKQQSKEIDPTSLNVLNKYSDDQDQIKKTKNSFKSMPSRNTINKSIQFPSQLSQISNRGQRIKNSKLNINRLSNFQVRLPSALEMVNLSQFNYKDDEEEEFEKMYNYTIYYPKGNVQNVIDSINRFRKKQKRRILGN